MTHAEITLPGAPRSIRWDKGGWLLDVADFPRPTAMLAWQMLHDDDGLGRIEAVTLLGERRDEGAAAAALTVATRDAFWAVRQRAVTALGEIAALRDTTPGPTSRATGEIVVTTDGGVTTRTSAVESSTGVLLGASHDTDSRVREAAATGLGGVRGGSGGASVVARLREMATADSSLYVRGAAIASYATVAPDSALALARVVMQRESWTDIERTRAIQALARVDRPGVVELLTSALQRPGASRPAREAAIESLATRAVGREAEVARIVGAQLDADDIFVRIAAARALGRLGQRSSVAGLEARRRVEAESRVVNEIDAALQALGAAGR